MEFGLRLKSIVAVGSLSSVVFGLACQAPLSNVVQGLIIAVSGPFATGDKIQCSGLTGVVEDFGWYQSVIRTDANDLVTLPNSMLAGKQVVNLSRRSAKKIATTLRLRYADLPKIEKLIGELKEVAKGMPSLMPGSSPSVNLVDYGVSAVEVKAAINVQPDANDAELRQKFLLAIAGCLKSNGVEFAPLQVDLAK